MTTHRDLSTDGLDYPNVLCERHGVSPSGAVACVHVILLGAPVASYLEPSLEDLGEVFCADCARVAHKATPRFVNNVRLLCRACLLEVLTQRFTNPQEGR
jgi:hypothetical protein